MEHFRDASCAYQDLDAIRRFFTEALGFVERSVQPDRVELVFGSFHRLTATRAEPGRVEPPSEHYQGRFTMGAHMYAMDRLVDRARAAGAEVVDVGKGSYDDGDEVDGVYTFTVVDPEGHRWRFDGVVALTG
ncbi:VOC family protein [Catellatospora sp. NPDC049111]|uniref:VOC family protein n=1 Tax=Catellatospora sp. NPDC049111 TaxID=3155271 RepID=UPI0034074FA4